MKLPVFCFLFLIGISISFEIFANAEQESDSLLIQLRTEIAQKKKYEDARQQRITECRKLLASVQPSNVAERFRLQSQLCELYKPFNYDSAFINIRRLQRLAYAMKDPVRITYSKTQLGFVLLSSGMFKETMDTLARLSMRDMPDTIRTDYYLIMARTYYDLVDFDRDTHFSPYYIELGNHYIDSARTLTEPDSFEHVYFDCLKNLKNENNAEALKDLSALLARSSLTPHEVAITASTLSFYYTSRDQEEQAIPLLARAAIEDIRTATKETVAIWKLAELLYHKGEIVDAYDFIQEAMYDAEFYGARQRKVQVGSILPVIAAAKLTNIEHQRRRWLIYSSVITLLTLTILAFAVIIFRELKKRRAAEKALTESNKIKEEYIGYYFNVNSDYVNKIEAFKKSVEMKLMTKKIDDIRTTIDSLNVKKEREELYNSFDRIFLKIYPDFVTTFNSWFAEADRIVLKEGQLMNTELRIFALIRMGIHENEKIARILDYSITTIYNYKARVKSKSKIANEDFERKIMEIEAR